ncbi:2-C-methyl-D-erythritol 4-phosphate cytidylyltransferase [Hoyosella subflava DQS3-9A1]|uniref:2-C-methyl-D-erythritol 4-phosphate cytidylyltransferase n=2 Tax=Hoyosella TaxID=697025 RepID=F6EN18_HOYSD|nr:2-C-methyl-D-erythritol 4-phosphate cytidylyltransferase [Hoyosella subflava DQS3-9A1]
MGSEGNKVFLPLAGRSLLSWTLTAVSETPEFERTILVIRPEDRALVDSILERDAADNAIEVIEGGSTRHESEFNALKHLAADIEAESIDVVVVHDAARPLAGVDMMRAAVSVAHEFGGAVPALPAAGLVRVNAEGEICAVPERDLVRVQTPQAFRAQPLLMAFEAAVAAGFEGTDTAASVENFADLTIRTFPGSERNLKVTFAHDLSLAERLLD